MSWIGKLIMRLFAGLLLVILMHTAPALAAAELPLVPSATVAAAGSPKATGRLRFKSAGPVCMCGEGLSERDIEAAMRRQGLARSGEDGKSSTAVEGQDRATMESKKPKGGAAR